MMPFLTASTRHGRWSWSRSSSSSFRNIYSSLHSSKFLKKNPHVTAATVVGGSRTQQTDCTGIVSMAILYYYEKLQKKKKKVHRHTRARENAVYPPSQKPYQSYKSSKGNCIGGPDLKGESGFKASEIGPSQLFPFKGGLLLCPPP